MGDKNRAKNIVTRPAPEIFKYIIAGPADEKKSKRISSSYIVSFFVLTAIHGICLKHLSQRGNVVQIEISVIEIGFG